MPGGDLERVLGSIFPEQAAAEAAARQKAGLGDVDPGMVANVQQDPGLAYQGGWTNQRAGPAGQVARAYSGFIDAIYAGIDRTKCPNWLTPECLDVVSRLLEQTFRNFQLTARPPSHIAPPFPARCIDCFNDVDLPGNTMYAAAGFVKLCCVTIPKGRWRGVVVDFGQALESAAAWLDVEWRVTLNGDPYPPYVGIRRQLWDSILRSKTCEIHLMPQDTLCLEAKSLSATPHHAFSRVFGWYYPVRSETGGGREIRSTIVD
jgi:hypothetical protein